MQPENINRLITGNYTEEESIHKRPLSKFVRDISINVVLIEKDISNKGNQVASAIEFWNASDPAIAKRNYFDSLIECRQTKV